MGLLCLTFVKLKIFHSKRCTLRCIMPTENKLDPLHKSTVRLPTILLSCRVQYSDEVS